MLAEQIHLPELPSGVSPIVPLGQSQWYAVQTTARREKRVAARLQEQGLFAFLPLIEQLHRWTDRQARIEVPLFGGYLFVHIMSGSENRLRVLRTPGVQSFVGSHPHGTPIAEQEIDNLRSAIRAKVPFQLHPFLAVGKRVRIRSGALTGIEGIVIGQGRDRHVVLSVELLRRSVAIRVDGYALELL